MLLKRMGVVTAVFLITLLSLNNVLQTASASPQATTLLYDSSLGTLPSNQSFEYQAINPDNFPNIYAVQATQTYSDPVAILNSSTDLGDYAGYAVPTDTLTLNRATGYQLRFDLRIVAENHNGNNNRAGFSVILLSEDLYGVETAFWENEIWVQEGNGTSLFTHAEGATYNTTAALTTYTLTIITDTYTLSANGTPLLSGILRQYTDWVPPFAFVPDPYEQPNFVFLGDNTSSAGATMWLGDVSIETDIITLNHKLYLPSVNKP